MSSTQSYWLDVSQGSTMTVKEDIEVSSLQINKWQPVNEHTQMHTLTHARTHTRWPGYHCHVSRCANSSLCLCSCLLFLSLSLTSSQVFWAIIFIKLMMIAHIVSILMSFCLSKRFRVVQRDPMASGKDGLGSLSLEKPVGESYTLEVCQVTQALLNACVL